MGKAMRGLATGQAAWRRLQNARYDRSGRFGELSKYDPAVAANAVRRGFPLDS